MKEFVQYIITNGRSTAENLQCSKLPQSLLDQDYKPIAELQGGGPQTSSNRSPQ